MCSGMKQKKRSCSISEYLYVLVVKFFMKGFIAIFLVLGTFLTACEKDDLKLQGTYSGTFIYTHPASSVAPPPSGPASITFSEHTYTSTGNPDKIPAGGSGTFEVTKSKSVIFKDQNVWTANFDWGLVLNGEYKYQVKGDSLYLAKYNAEFKVYEYRLKRTGN
jgi:hypothetical protein